MTTTGDLVPYAAGQVDGYRPQIMTPEAARALDEQVRMCTRAVLREGTDYGIIPGTGGGKVLFRPGAQKLLQWFGLAFTCERVELERDDQGRKHGITYRATIARRLDDGTIVTVATCEGTADYDEDKFYQSAETVQHKAEAKERSFAAKDRRPPNPNKWKHLGEYRAPWNTLMKRAQKRAIVGAVIDATAAGGLFTADDDSEHAAADGGPSWYQRALGEAADITTQEDADRLANDATQAVLGGLATPRQADHVKNSAAARLRRLGGVRVVDVEDLAEATERRGLRPARTPNVPPAEGSAPAAAPVSPVTAEPAGGTSTPGGESSPRLTSGQFSLIKRHFARIGTDAENVDYERGLEYCARLARLAGPLGAYGELSQDEAADIIDTLKPLPDGEAGAKALAALLNDGEVPDAG